jgi:hypothetical protein
LVAAALGFASSRAALANGTPAGTAIVNSATASYSDGAGHAFTVTSNSVTTTVQSVPSLTIVPGEGVQDTVPGGQVLDVFIVTNTGNGNATFTLATPVQTGTDGTSASLAGYTVFNAAGIAGATPAGCSPANTLVMLCGTLAELNAVLANQSIGTGKDVGVGVIYDVANTAAAGTVVAPATVITSLNATSSQSAANNPGSSGTVTSAPLATPTAITDDVLGDARLDLTKAGVNSTTGTTPTLTYTISGADGGYTAAHDLNAVKALLGGTAPAGIFITDAIPQFGGAPLTVQSIAVATNAANGYAAGALSYYYTTAATPASGWTAFTAGTAPPAGTTYVGVLLSGGANGIELNPNDGATSTGHVTAAQAALTITLVVNAPSGGGAGLANAVVNQADSVIGGGEASADPSAITPDPAPFIIGPAIPFATSDSTSAAALTATGTGLAYPTQAAGTAATQSGASNAVGNAAPAAAAVFNGPFGNPTATGSYNGTAPVNASDDFSAVAYAPAAFVPTNASATGVAGNALGATATGAYAVVQNTLQNQGNVPDTITVTAAAPAGWTVAIFASGANVATATPLSGPAAATATAVFAAVPSGSASSTTNQVNYQVVYYPNAAATAFTTYDSLVTATSGNAPAVSNTTHDEIVIGGALALTKSLTLDTATCPGGVTVPGCILKYALTYTNNALPASQCPATPPTTFPAYEAGYFVKGLTISENGKAGPSTWGGTYTTASGATAYKTSGLNAPATDTFASTTFSGNTVGSYAFTATIGGTSGLILAPGCSGTITFAVTVSTS